MDDLISRQAALAVIRTRLQDFAAYGNEEYRRGLYACEDIIISLPSVDRPKGEWIHTDAYPHKVYCSVCYGTYLKNEKWAEELGMVLHPDFCLHCGADMRGDTDEE